MPKIRYQMRAQSGAAFAASMLALLSGVLLCILYWPLFVQQFTGGVYEGPALSPLSAPVYGVLISSVLLFALFTGLLGRRNLALSGIFSIPVLLFLALDVCGLKTTVLFLNYDNVLYYYREPHPFFRGWWVFVALVCLVLLAALNSYLRTCFHRARALAICNVLVWLAAAVWTAYSALHVIYFELPQLRSGAYSTRDILYALMYYGSALLFLCALVVIVSSLRKTIVGGENTAVPQQHETPVVADDWRQPVPAPAPVPAAQKAEPGYVSVPLGALDTGIPAPDDQPDDSRPTEDYPLSDLDLSADDLLILTEPEAPAEAPKKSAPKKKSTGKSGGKKAASKSGGEDKDAQEPVPPAENSEDQEAPAEL